MTSGYRVLCSDGVSRHGELFATSRDALTWQTWRHVCHLGHHLRREATFTLPPAPTSQESECSGPGAGGISFEIDLTEAAVR